MGKRLQINDFPQLPALKNMLCSGGVWTAFAYPALTGCLDLPSILPQAADILAQPPKPAAS
jgi:hypothetical protein